MIGPRHPVVAALAAGAKHPGRLPPRDLRRSPEVERRPTCPSGRRPSAQRMPAGARDRTLPALGNGLDRVEAKIASTGSPRAAAARGRRSPPARAPHAHTLSSSSRLQTDRNPSGSGLGVEHGRGAAPQRHDEGSSKPFAKPLRRSEPVDGRIRARERLRRAHLTRPVMTEEAQEAATRDPGGYHPPSRRRTPCEGDLTRDTKRVPAPKTHAMTRRLRRRTRDHLVRGHRRKRVEVADGGEVTFAAHGVPLCGRKPSAQSAQPGRMARSKEVA